MSYLLQKKLGNNIRKLRQIQGLTQDALSEKSNMDPNYLSAIECGRKNCTLDYLEKISKGLGIEIHELFLFIPPLEENSDNVSSRKNILIEKIKFILESSNDESILEKILTIIQIILSINTTS